MNIQQLNIELSSRCDRQTICGFCGHQDRKTNPDLKFGDISFALLTKIASQVPAGTIISFHRDGDPLVYPFLQAALAIFREFPTSIVTHGEALGKRAHEIIGNCTTVTVSVIPKDKDREIQLRSLAAFMALKGDKAPQLQLKFVGHIEDSAAYEALGLPIIGRSLHSKKGNWNYAQREPPVPEVRVCLDFLSRPTIDWRGRVFICNRLDTKDSGLLGDLNENSLQEILNGAKRLEMLKHHLAGHRELANDLCKGCSYWGIPTNN